MDQEDTQVIGSTMKVGPTLLEVIMDPSIGNLIVIILILIGVVTITEVILSLIMSLIMSTIIMVRASMFLHLAEKIARPSLPRCLQKNLAPR